MAGYYQKHYNKVAKKLTIESTGDDFIELLAVSLAEKLCFQVNAVLEWIKRTKMNAKDLANIHRRLALEGVGSKFASRVLIAFVNEKRLDKSGVKKR